MLRDGARVRLSDADLRRRYRSDYRSDAARDEVIAGCAIARDRINSRGGAQRAPADPECVRRCRRVSYTRDHIIEYVNDV